MQIRSLAARYIHQQGRADIADDLGAFDMTLLHYRRTFVEKLFALHGKVIRLQQENNPLGRDARHYCDLHVLAAQPKVKAMLESSEYEAIRIDYDQISRTFYPKSYRPPPNLSFANSPALFPDPDLRARLETDYQAQCALLFSGGAHPEFDEVLNRFVEIRQLL